MSCKDTNRLVFTDMTDTHTHTQTYFAIGNEYCDLNRKLQNKRLHKCLVQIAWLKKTWFKKDFKPINVLKLPNNSKSLTILQ